MSSYIKWLVAAGVLYFSRSPAMALITLSILYIIELMNDDSGTPTKNKPQNNGSQTESNADIGLVILCAAIMNIDRQYHMNQYAFIRSFLSQNFNAQHVAQRMTLLDRLLLKNNNIDDACRRVMYYTPIESRHQIVNFLFGLAAADGNVSFMEMMTIKKIAEFLYVDYETFLMLKGKYYREQRRQNYSSPPPNTHTYVEDFYAVLQIKKEANNQEVKTAYRKLVLQYHPDRWISKSVKEQELARKKFQDLQNAYDKIKAHRGMV